MPTASEPSDVGTAFIGATVAVMFSLAWAKRRAGAALHNRPLVANASMTFIDGCLAAGVLVALAAQRIAGWWWADPLTAGVVALVALNEARAHWKSHTAAALPGPNAPGELASAEKDHKPPSSRRADAAVGRPGTHGTGRPPT